MQNDKPNKGKPELAPEDNGAENQVEEKTDPKISVEPEKAPPKHKAEEELLYLKAEFDNYRKRIQREQDQAVKFANEKIIGELLTLVDNFEKALTAADSLTEKKEQSVANFVQGVQMNYRELIHLLTRFGVEFIGSVGEEFDPARHEAISQEPTTPDKVGKVTTVFQKGCWLNGRLLKPARVVVGTAAK